MVESNTLRGKTNKNYDIAPIKMQQNFCTPKMPNYDAAKNSVL